MLERWGTVCWRRPECFVIGLDPKRTLKIQNSEGQGPEMCPSQKNAQRQNLKQGYLDKRHPDPQEHVTELKR